MVLTTRQMNQVEDRMKQMVNELMELGVDTVQIITTNQNKDKNWVRMSQGGGNIYARQKACMDWTAAIDDCEDHIFDVDDEDEDDGDIEI